ncbi:sulfotransferase family 2 domain-containing protein [Pseudodonghicola flavimaris]|uniref:Sulfotransferase family 2 domain-containing protein n=1 Tax=Pseudodonghicola flavimaris TaxID=3050036 RepID=A0ABT7EW98_9RHOB|nr:sulfotransferase family 2 domain-containing protein [Pseudodonghicola flavimaris]MDK3016622.1 sulfotransferase family 2 domain-containing protein [Pseudodonghicola flavimaris]
MTVNGVEFYDAPKNAGTTMRMWLKHYEQRLPETRDWSGYYTLRGLGLPTAWHNNAMVHPQFFSPGEEGNIRFCIKRDPIDRFISAYTDKVLHEKLAPWSIDTCLSMIESGEMEAIARSDDPYKLAASHFLDQCTWFGPQMDYFDHVFDIHRMDAVRAFCQDVVFKMPLPPFHARNAKHLKLSKIELAPSQYRYAQSVFAPDYAAGWS